MIALREKFLFIFSSISNWFCRWSLLWQMEFIYLYEIAFQTFSALFSSALSSMEVCGGARAWNCFVWWLNNLFWDMSFNLLFIHSFSFQEWMRELKRNFTLLATHSYNSSIHQKNLRAQKRNLFWQNAIYLDFMNRKIYANFLSMYISSFG